MGLYNANIIGGKSAYVSALEGGYTGTESEFYSTLGNLGLTFSSTLATGETTVVFEDERLTTESVLDSVYTSIFGVKVKSATFGEGSLTLEFPTQTEDMEIKAVVDADVSDNLVGASGEKGADGKSAYQYAVDGGFEGTEEEFASLMASGGSNDALEWKLGGTATNTITTNIKNFIPDTAKEINIYYHTISGFTNVTIPKDRYDYIVSNSSSNNPIDFETGIGSDTLEFEGYNFTGGSNSTTYFYYR